MKRIFVIAGLALLLASCSKVGQKFDQRNSGSPGAATSGGDASSSGASTTSAGSSSSADTTGGQTVERPQPTAEQMAAIEGGQEAKWDQQGMTWTVPKDWKQMSVETKSLLWSGRRGGDLASLIVNISPMDDNFPTDVSLKAFYDGAVTRRKNGEVDEVRWLELDGVKGVAFRETMPEGAEDPRRLQWITYRKYAGQTQMVNLMLATAGRSFEKNKDTFYGILYSTKLVH
ncbi:MAG TPA: membrane lipoprotein lipid attachment site-containing protein [Pyrinomonadaceae bacterium]|nr:membrane lipoprotein lipid attachment site-containing protein [Pyrinomonadaceae bacterium]